MVAPKGNRFWEQRSKHGRDRIFATPEAMWEAACEYFEWCENNPLIESKPFVVSSGNNMGSSVELTEIPKMRVFSMNGLCRYLNCNKGYFAEFKRTLKPEESGFADVIAKIEETIYEQKFSGAASGFFNANIIARDLGLSDHQKIDAKNTQINTTPLTPEEIKQISEELDNEV